MTGRCSFAPVSESDAFREILEARIAAALETPVFADVLATAASQPVQ